MRGRNGLDPQQRSALRELTSRGVLTEQQLAEVCTAVDTGTRRPAAGGLWEVLGYLGGALVLGGAGLLVGLSWAELARGVRVGLLVFATLALAGAAWWLRGSSWRPPERGPRTRIASVLLVLCSLTAAMALGSGLSEVHGLAITALGCAVAVVGYLALPGVPGLVAMGAWSVALVAATCDEWFDGHVVPMTVGLALLAVFWAAMARAGTLISEHLGLGGAAAIGFAAAQWPLGSAQPNWAYALTAAFAALCFGGYLRRGHAALVFFGVLAVTAVVPEAITDWTDGALGGGLLVLLTGVVLLVAGGFGLRLHRSGHRSATDSGQRDQRDQPPLP